MPSETEMQIASIARVLSRSRFSLSTESALQRDMAEALAAAGFAFAREVRLSDRDRIDFLIGTIGVEAKIKGSRSAIYRQCERYCARACIRGLILASNVPMGLPPAIGSTPVRFVHLGRAWL